LVGKSQSKTLHMGLKARWEDNIEMVIKKTRYEVAAHGRF